MGVWLQLRWGVSCDCPFTLSIEEGANHGHLLNAVAWLTAGVEAVSVAAGDADEELKADLIPLVLSCHPRPEPGGEWEAILFSLLCDKQPLCHRIFLTCLFLLGGAHDKAPSPREERILQIQRQLPVPPSEWLVGSEALSHSQLLLRTSCPQDRSCFR